MTPLIEEVWRCSGVVVLWKVARDTPGVDHFVRLTKITPPRGPASSDWLLPTPPEVKPNFCHVTISGNDLVIICWSEPSKATP